MTDHQIKILELEKKLKKITKQKDELQELVIDCARSKDVDEAWGASERCYDYIQSYLNGENE